MINKETEPDLVRAVNFALKEYPQLLRYLDDGKLAFSNNICELQMRQIAIYRNQSYFLGSVKSAKRFARLVSLTQSAKNCKRNVQKYFHDILNRVVVTVKDELSEMRTELMYYKQKDYFNEEKTRPEPTPMEKLSLGGDGDIND